VNGNGGGPTTPTKTPTSSPTKSLLTGQCVDSPIDWHDSDGSYYNCEWYGEANRCANYGDGHRNRGKNANEACCACGGGNSGGNTAPSTNDTPRPTPSPTKARTARPTPSPTRTSTGRCKDSPIGWYDSDGPFFNCEWYAKANRCANFGDGHRNQGKNAQEACCACGGGETQ